MNLIDSLREEQRREDMPPFRPGDTVRVHVKVVERIQTFEGFVMRRRGYGLSATFTVRRVSYGVGVERTFPVESPRVEKVELLRRGKVRRARLYYLRGLRGKAARIQARSQQPSGKRD